jgi:hypothetical protein
MRDDSRPASELREALDAVLLVTGSIREALDAVHGTAPEPDESADDFFWDAGAPRELWLRRLGQANWVLIFTIVGTIAIVAGVIVADLAWMKPH